MRRRQLLPAAFTHCGSDDSRSQLHGPPEAPLPARLRRSAHAAPERAAGPTPASQEAQELHESGLGVLQGDAQLAAQGINPASEEAQELRQSGMRPLGSGGCAWAQGGMGTQGRT